MRHSLIRREPYRVFRRQRLAEAWRGHGQLSFIEKSIVFVMKDCRECYRSSAVKESLSTAVRPD